VKAQTYLDFLSHDIANMISPIMNRAEIILQSPNASDKQKDEAGKIVEQTQKVASLIANLRRLSRAERIDVNSFDALDLRTLLPELVRTRREANPDRKLRVVIQIPDESEVAVIGGSVAEEIIEEVFDNAIKHSGKDTNRITIGVSPEDVSTGKPAWNIEIMDDGPGIPDHTKSALNVTSSDPGKRYTRGVASSLSIMSLVAEHLGGRIKVEDRVVGDYTQGARVTITLPRAPIHTHGNT
jgi:signal transduction histidine kinase